MRRVPKPVWIVLGAAAIGSILIPRFFEFFHRTRLTWMTEEEQLEYAVQKTVGAILGTNRSENLTLIVGTPIKTTVEGVYVVAYIGKEVTPTDSFGIAVSDASSGADCLCGHVPLGEGYISVGRPSPHCALPTNQFYEVMRELTSSIEQWQVPPLGHRPRVRVEAVFLHPPPKQASFRLSRSTNTVNGRTTTLGPTVEQVVVTADVR
jgi:hypothetical protein